MGRSTNVHPKMFNTHFLSIPFPVCEDVFPQVLTSCVLCSRQPSESKMSFLCGLQSATRNRFLSGVNSLASWRQWKPLGCPQARRHWVVNASWGLNTVSQRHLLTLQPGNFRFCRTLSNKKSRYFSNGQSQETGVLIDKWTFPRHGVREGVGGPAPAALCPLSCPAARAARSFHTSPRALAAPVPLLLLILKPVQKLLAIIVGR